MLCGFQGTAFQPTAFQNCDGGGVTPTPPAEVLANVYGGGLVAKKDVLVPKELSLVEKVEVISLAPEGKERIARVLPRARRPEAPDLMPVEDLARVVVAAGKRVAAQIDRLYEHVLDEDDSVALGIIFGVEGDYSRKDQ